MINDLLKQGISALQAGRKAKARNLLMQVVEQDERNEVAWLWLSGAVDTDKERRICLENVLAINPNNGVARRGLESLTAKGGVRPLSTVSPPAPDIKSLKGELAMQPVMETGEVIKSQAQVSTSELGRLENREETSKMRTNLPAPIAAFVATLVAVGRLSLITQTRFVTGVGPVGGGSIIDYLFFGYGTLEPNVGIHLLFATIVLWMIVFTFLWLVLSLLWLVLSFFARKSTKGL